MQNIHKAMAVLYRPIKQRHKHQYLIEDYKAEDTNIMKDMPMDAVLSSILFFYNLGMDLSKAMLNSLEEEETSLLQQEILGKNGDGIKLFLDSLKEILQSSKISLN